MPSLAAAYADGPFLIDDEIFMVPEDHLELTVSLKIVVVVVVVVVMCVR